MAKTNSFVPTSELWELEQARRLRCGLHRRDLRRLGVTGDLVTRSVDPTGTGRPQWAQRRKPVINAFAITFGDSASPARILRSDDSDANAARGRSRSAQYCSLGDKARPIVCPPVIRIGPKMRGSGLPSRRPLHRMLRGRNVLASSKCCECSAWPRSASHLWCQATPDKGAQS